MAVVTVFNGTLTASAKGSWVAVNQSAAYTIQISGVDAAGIGVEFSVDGTNAIQFNQIPTLVSPSGTFPKAYLLSNTPVAWMRAANGYSGQSATGTVFVQVL